MDGWMDCSESAYSAKAVALSPCGNRICRIKTVSDKAAAVSPPSE